VRQEHHCDRHQLQRHVIGSGAGSGGRQCYAVVDRRDVGGRCDDGKGRGVRVLAGDTSTIPARAETSALASSQGTAVAAGATIALNVIGWEFSGTGGLLAATVDTLLGSDVATWTDPFPTDVTASGNTANVTARITDSTTSA